MDSESKLKRLLDDLAGMGSVLIAYSGGVDSSLLSVLASEVPGITVKCVLLDSPLVPRRMVDEAIDTAERYGFDCGIMDFAILEDDEFVKNPKNRCYICKKASARILKRLARELGMIYIADGTNTSDLNEYRPGLAAGNEEGIAHPFVDAGISKDDIRKIAAGRSLAFCTKPSAACLASRLPYGDVITEDKLGMIEEAEDYLIKKGFSQVRVRIHGRIARIELDPSEAAGALANARAICERFEEIGFTYVTLDLAGYRTGSMDMVA
ncbi:MAG: ATP-dependent sacrificial sulfur transferase LarE [Methanoregulaceae archaeon]|nr:ATP-dependent sacrificial sulfur transferase LarE [Methanoregulaceae archaeon]